MNIQHDVNLAQYSTMALGGRARYLVHVSTKSELQEALEFAAGQAVHSLMIGGGSNIIWQDSGFPGLVIVSEIKGFDLTWRDQDTAIVKIGSGEIWDKVVERCCSRQLSGIETLSLIPGKAGATPVQNVGAYGQEIADTLIELEAYDSQTQSFVTVTKTDCRFGYRTSRFKTVDHGRFFITSLTLQLSKATMQPPFYSSLQRYLDQYQITDFSPQSIRKAVIAIRSAKLPDPSLVHNNGSFFANPIVSGDQYKQLQQTYPNIPGWLLPDNQVKVPAAWLIEQVGFKGYHDQATGMATWQKQPLVLVNESAKSTADLITFRDRVIKTVKDQFEINLTQEPELLP